MKAFLKTLFGDAATIAVVSAVMAAEVALVAAGHVALGPLLIPAAVVAGVAWLAAR